MKVGEATRQFLRALAGPPSPEQMQDMVFALAHDGDVDWLRRTAETMVDHHLKRSADEDRTRFYWWLGIRGAITSFMNGVERRRDDRRFRRVVRAARSARGAS